MEPWSDVDVTGWSVEQPEPRGKRPKFWVRDPEGGVWLRKEPRESRPTEPAVEALVLRLARAVGIDAVESRACTWSVGDATRRGLIVRIFTSAREELSLGSIELRAMPDYDPEQKKLHTLDRVRSVLRALEEQAGVPMLEPFVRLLAFDAWIGNSDRHQENWGVLHRAGRPIGLAPMFDPAACLGVELGDGRPELRPEIDLDGYIERCSSGFGDGAREKPLLSQRAVVENLRSWPEWTTTIAPLLAAFGSTVNTFEAVVRAVPREWLSETRAAFVCRLLRARLAWLSQRSST